MDHLIEVRSAWRDANESDENWFPWRIFCHNYQGFSLELEELYIEELVTQQFETVFGTLMIWWFDCGGQAKVWTSQSAGYEKRVSKQKILATKIISFQNTELFWKTSGVGIISKRKSIVFRSWNVFFFSNSKETFSNV